MLNKCGRDGFQDSFKSFLPCISVCPFAEYSRNVLAILCECSVNALGIPNHRSIFLDIHRRGTIRSLSNLCKLAKNFLCLIHELDHYVELGARKALVLSALGCCLAGCQQCWLAELCSFSTRKQHNCIALETTLEIALKPTLYTLFSSFNLILLIHLHC